MTNTPFDITDFLSVTDFSAIENCVCLLSNSDFMYKFTHKQLSEPQTRRFGDKIRCAISEVAYSCEDFNNNIKSSLKLFAMKSNQNVHLAKKFASCTNLGELQTACNLLKNEWEIQEQNVDSVEKDIKLNGYSNWSKHLALLFPPQEEDELREQIIKNILFLCWSLHKAHVIMSNFIDEENRIRADCDMSFELFKKQKAALEKQIENSNINTEDESNIERFANNLLVRTLHGKENKDNISKLYHHYSDDATQDITEQTMIEYILYEKALAHQKEMARADQAVNNPILVMDDAILNRQIKHIIDHLPEITTLKIKNDTPYVDNNTCASIIALANKMSKGTDMNVHRYICLKYKAPSSYGGISPKVKEIREIIEKKSTGEEVVSSDNYRFFCNFRDKVIGYNKKISQQLPPVTPSYFP